MEYLVSSQMGFDAYADIKGIKGDSLDEKHREWIDVLGLHWGVSQPAGTGGGAVQERADFDDLTIVKMLDTASPTLYAYCARGTKINRIVIELCHATGKHHTFGKIKVSKAIISRVQVLSAVGKWTAVRPIEEVSCRYEKIEWEFVPIDLMGQPGATVKGGWDLAGNVPV